MSRWRGFNVKALPTDVSALGDFVRRTKQRLSRQPPARQAQGDRRQDGEAVPANEILSIILQSCKEIAQKENDPMMIVRAELAEMILPRVLVNPDPTSAQTGSQVDNKQAKIYAFACGQLVGLLAGLSLREDGIDQAIDEVLAEAKRSAHGAVGILNKQGLHSTPLNGTSAAEPASMRVQQRAMIDDLERQAAVETDLATAAALRQMAARMKKELSDSEAASGAAA